MSAFLQIANIETLYFDRIYALYGVTLEVREGEIFAVLGPNGAGKTTLLKTVAGLLKDQPKKGSIQFDGRASIGWRRRQCPLWASSMYRRTGVCSGN